MDNAVKIENVEMQIREYSGERVVTLKDVDTVHRKKDGTSRGTFNRYKKHFIEGVDYFKITRKELHDILSRKEELVGNPNTKTYLFTESGYLMIVKAFTDDLAWEVQRKLVNGYFRAKSAQTEQPQPDRTLNDSLYHTSSTPVPKTVNWFQRNNRRMGEICERANAPRKTLYHHILVRLGEEYDLAAANRIYAMENGYPPRYAIDIVSYFPELAALADEYLDKMEVLRQEKED